uniref:Uncharacterized protein n=1 Tax=Triticum urartu TaxID=4572 RepID=A0A8R7V870_TRIUA
SPLCPLARGLCLPSLRLRRRRETIGGLLPGERVRVCAAAAREDVGVRRGGDRGHGVERGAGGVHVPVPLRRPLPDHARRPPPRGGDRALPLLLALPHRRLQRGGLRRRQGAPAEAAGRRAARRRRLSGAHRTPRGWLVGMDGTVLMHPLIESFYVDDLLFIYDCISDIGCWRWETMPVSLPCFQYH